MRTLCTLPRGARPAAFAAVVLVLVAGGLAVGQRGNEQAESGRSQARQPKGEKASPRESSPQQQRLTLPGTNEILRVDVQSPRQIRVGDSYEYEVRVTNMTDNLVLHDVTIEQTKTDGFTIESSRVENSQQARSGAGSEEPRRSQGRQQPQEPRAKRTSEESQQENQEAGQQPDNRPRQEEQQRQQAQQQQQGQQKNDNHWTIDKLAPGQSRSIFITASSDAEGRSQACIAVMSYRPALCLSTEFVKPDLKIVKTAPEIVELCEEIEFAYHIQNEGSGPTGRLTIEDNLDEGLQTASGKDKLEFTIDNLEPGETRKFVAKLRAERAGTFSSRALVQDAEGGQTRSQAVTTEVRQPELAVALEGPQVEYFGRPATYTIRVTNHGEVPAPDASLALFLAPGTRLAGASEPRPSSDAAPRQVSSAPGQSQQAAGEQSQDEQQPPDASQQEEQAGDRVSAAQAKAQQPERRQDASRQRGQQASQGRGERGLEQAQRAREWQLGTLEPGQTMAVRVTVIGRQAGDHTHRAVASYICARGEEQTRIATRDRVRTEVISLPALLVAVVDQRDPVAVGEEVVYSVVVQNQGTAPDQNIRVEAELPEQLEFSEATGETEVKAEGQKLTFQPIEELGPGEKASWQVRAKGNRPGELQMRVHLQSDSMQQRVTTEEPTRLFAGGEEPAEQQAERPKADESERQ